MPTIEHLPRKQNPHDHEQDDAEDGYAAEISITVAIIPTKAPATSSK